MGCDRIPVVWSAQVQYINAASTGFAECSAGLREIKTMADSALQRKNMVESQVRPSDVTDRRIMAAMQDIPRERFVPEGQQSLAYMDETIPFGPGRGLLAPRIFARLVQLANIGPDDKVLDVGCLTGYSSAVLKRLGGQVVALESDAALAGTAKALLAAQDAKLVDVVTGALAAGHAAAGPYDVIVVEGAAGRIPEALTSQLALGGRLVAIETTSRRLSQAVIVTKSASGLTKRVAFEASGTLLPGFEKPAVFAF